MHAEGQLVLGSAAPDTDAPVKQQLLLLLSMRYQPFKLLQ